ncbi:MAG TPA: ABC transporter [Firmicutes bacterium]|jgi:ABC-2 type transport system ATP-binding protein|nr:ABC transporter [Bacillota bacterium]
MRKVDARVEFDHVCIEYESWRYERMRRVTQRIRALDNVALSFSPGEIVGVKGPNGSGKSSLLRAMCGMHAPVSGRVLVFGKPPNLFDSRFKRRIAYSSSRRTSLLPDLPLIDSFILRRELFAMSRADWEGRMHSLVDRLSLGALTNRPAREFSQGQRARAELAIALLHGPSLILLDETTEALDLQYLPGLLALLSELSADGATVCMISHRPDDLECAHRVVTIDGGRVAADERIRCTTAGS